MKVKFVPIDKEFEITPDKTVRDICDENGIFVKSVCNGLPSCAECRVRVVEGDHNVLPPSAKELSLIGTGHFIDQRRLSCQIRCFGNVTIDLSEQLEKQTESQGPRRPQGAIKKDISLESQAVSGSLLEQEGELKSSGSVSEPRSQNETGRRKKPPQRRDGRGRSGASKKAGSEKKPSQDQPRKEKEGDGSQKKSSRNRRRRHRPRPKE